MTSKYYNNHIKPVNSGPDSHYTNKLYNQGSPDLSAYAIKQLMERIEQESITRELKDNRRRGGICPIHHIYYNYKHECDLCS